MVKEVSGRCMRFAGIRLFFTVLLWIGGPKGAFILPARPEKLHSAIDPEYADARTTMMVIKLALNEL